MNPNTPIFRFFFVLQKISSVFRTLEERRGKAVELHPGQRIIRETRNRSSLPEAPPPPGDRFSVCSPVSSEWPDLAFLTWETTNLMRADSERLAAPQVPHPSRTLRRVESNAAYSARRRSLALHLYPSISLDNGVSAWETPTFLKSVFSLSLDFPLAAGERQRTPPSEMQSRKGGSSCRMNRKPPSPIQLHWA